MTNQVFLFGLEMEFFVKGKLSKAFLLGALTALAVLWSSCRSIAPAFSISLEKWGNTKLLPYVQLATKCNMLLHILAKETLRGYETQIHPELDHEWLRDDT